MSVRRSRAQSQLIPRAVLAVLFIYAALGGALMPGMLTPRYQMVSMLLFGLSALGWAFVRIRRRWQWQATVLDGVVILWLVAIGLSLGANLDVWRRIVIGLWYTGLYICVWYLLQDTMLNRWLKRDTLVDTVLLTGLILMIPALLQLRDVLPAVLTIVRTPDVAAPPLFDLLRVSGMLDNPNRLAPVLVVLIPLALSRLWIASAAKNRLWQIIWALYVLLAMLLLVSTGSRGGWLSGMAAVLTFGALHIVRLNLFSVRRLRAWWSARSGAVRALTAILGMLAVLIVVGVTLVIVQLTILRTIVQGSDQRGQIYSIAFQLFKEKPITGSGLFTFGRGLIRLESMPPDQIHSHAHSLPLTVAAELGGVGILVLAITVIVILLAMRRVWRRSPEERVLLAGAIASCIGFGVAHCFDFAGLTALVALAGLMALIIAITPPPIPPAEKRPQPRQLAPVFVGVAVIVLLVAGAVNNVAYARYAAALEPNAGDVVAGIQSAIDADPAMPPYYWVRGFILGVLASTKDTNSAATAMSAVYDFQRFLSIEPEFAPAWANLGAVYWQIGQRDQAVQAMTRAAQAAPHSALMFYNLGNYQELNGDEAGARRSYTQMLTLSPEMSVSPVWAQTPFRKAFIASYQVAVTGTMHPTLTALLSGQKDRAASVWANASTVERASQTGRILNVILDAVNNQRDRLPADIDALRRQAQASLNTGTLLAENGTTYIPWAHLAFAYAAFYSGDIETARSEWQAAQQAVPADPPLPMDIARAQFLVKDVSQYMLPQLYAPIMDPYFEALGTRLDAELKAAK